MSEADPIRIGRELRNPVTGSTLAFVERSAELLVMEAGYPAGGPLAVAHLHPTQQERFRVLAGAVRVVVAGKERVLSEGEEVTIPPGTVHQFGGAPDQAGRVRWEVRPPLRTAELIATGFGLAADGRVNQRTGSPGLLQSALMLREFDREFRVPSPPRPVQRLLFGALAGVARRRGLRPSYVPAAFRGEPTDRQVS